MRRVHRLSLSIAFTAFALLLFMQPGSACAETLPSPAVERDDTPQPSIEIESRTILVTANKRLESAQLVPMSLWVGSAEQLDRAQVRDFDDLVRVEPSLTITKTTQPGNNSINIRGIGTYAFSIATRPSVSVIVDDVPQAFQAQAFRELADIGSIEVLRGPQSTLFGTSATAGVVNIKTVSPTATLSAGARVGFTSDAERRASAYISGPLGQNLLFRLSASANDYKGNLQNIYNSHWVDGQSGVDLRAKLVWQVSDALTITAASYYDRSKSTCCTSAYYAVTPGVTFGNFGGIRVPQSTILNGIVPGNDNRSISADIDPQGNANESGGSVRVEWTKDAYIVTSISSLAHYSLHDLQDTDGTSFDWGPAGAGVASAVAGGSANGGKFDIQSTTQELRLTSPSADRFRVVAGLFYSRIRSKRDFVRGSNDLGQNGTLTTVPPTTSAYSSYLARSLDTNYAFFANSTFDITKRLAVVAGVRLNRNVISYQLIDRIANVSYGIPDCSTATPSGLKVSTCDTLDSLAGRIALQYTSANIMFFGSYDRGYKGAAYDLTSTYTTRTPVTQAGQLLGFPVADAVAAKQPISPETVDAFQIGWKSRISGRLIWNVTFFQETFHDFQAQSRDEVTRQNVLNSIGQVTTKGVEMEITADMSDNLKLHFYGTYNEARIKAFPNAACYSNQTPALGCVRGEQDLSGKPLPNAPMWKVSLSAEHDERLGPDLGLKFIANWTWQSSVVKSLLQDPNSVQGAYGLFGLGIELHGQNKSFRIYCANLFDKSFALNKGRDGNWNINPYGATAGAISDATKWIPARDSSRYVRVEFAVTF